MGNLLRRIFNPTKEERIKDLRILIELHKKNFGNCCTCVNHEGSIMPGFVTDYGECLKNASWFTRKVLDGNNEFPCSFYEENTEHVQNLEHQIKLLSTEYPPLSNHFTKTEE